jgi:predicted peptidase
MKQICPAIYLLLIFYFGAPPTLSSQSSHKFSVNHYISEKGDTLLYRQLFPDSDTIRRFPLVIFLHGSGERGNDNEAQLKWGVMNFATDENMIRFPAFVIAPQCPAGISWANISRDRAGNRITLQPTPTRPMQLLMELIEKAKKTLRVDTNRIYITGLSMGAFGTFDALMRYPRVFAAAVPVCGGGDISKASTIAHIPTWIFHGAEDPAVSPLLSHEMLVALTRAGANPGYTQYPEVGHFSWLGAYSDPQMMQWLFRQRKQ